MVLSHAIFYPTKKDAKMKIAVTGATGFLGRYLVSELLAGGHQVVAWFRGERCPTFHDPRGRTDSAESGLCWIPGKLGDQDSVDRLLADADAVVHSALSHDRPNFMDDPADPIEYFETNFIGSLRLLQSAASRNVKRFIYVSSGAVHQRVLTERPLDETHPLWPESLYGASKASVETLIHAYGYAGKLDCCTIRPTAIYGLHDPVTATKWYELIRDVASGKDVEVVGGSKEVHAADVAKAIGIALCTDAIVAGETYNCSDRMISRHEVAETAKRLSGSDAIIRGAPKVAKNKIDTAKIQKLGMTFGGTPLLQQTIRQVLQKLRAQ